MTTETTAPQTLFGSDVIDADGNKIGSVDGVWVDDATNEAEFIAVKTGWLFGKNNIVPLSDARISGNAINLPYAQAQIKDAPSFAADEELSPEQEDEIYGYYGIQRSTRQSPSGLPAGGEGTRYDTAGGGAYDTGVATTAQDTIDQGENADMTLSEEELQVGKRQVEAGRVRLRKVVHTEHQEIPVDLRREEIEIERVPASQVGTPNDAFQEDEIEVPVMREEPVVAKEAHVTGGVRVSKDATVETRTVGDDVRTEDFEVDRNVD